jgi:hypothetical protein
MVCYHVVQFAGRAMLSTRFAFSCSSGPRYSLERSCSKNLGLLLASRFYFQACQETDWTHLEISSRFSLCLLLGFSFWVLLWFIHLVALSCGDSILGVFPANALSRIRALGSKVVSYSTKTLSLMESDRKCARILIRENRCWNALFFGISCEGFLYLYCDCF